MTKMTYHVFSLLIDFDGVAKRIEVTAVDLNAAMADVKNAYTGEIRLIQYAITGFVY